MEPLANSQVGRWASSAAWVSMKRRAVLSQLPSYAASDHERVVATELVDVLDVLDLDADADAVVGESAPIRAAISSVAPCLLAATTRTVIPITLPLQSAECWKLRRRIVPGQQLGGQFELLDPLARANPA